MYFRVFQKEILNYANLCKICCFQTCAEDQNISLLVKCLENSRLANGRVDDVSNRRQMQNLGGGIPVLHSARPYSNPDVIT